MVASAVMVFGMFFMTGPTFFVLKMRERKFGEDLTL